MFKVAAYSFIGFLVYLVSDAAWAGMLTVVIAGLMVESEQR